MKIFIALLACVVAANAYTIPSSYTYSYFCSHNYYVIPTSSCYSYTSYFPNTWCHSSYYTSILKVYPGTDCGNSRWSETPVKTITDELKNLLKASLARVTRQMYNNRDSFAAKIDSIHAAYKNVYKTYLYKYYSYRYRYCTYVGIPNYYNERTRKISQYCAQLDAKKKTVIDSFNAAIAKNIEAIKTYHDKLVKSATDCLNNRLAKISQFKSAMSKKVDDFVSKFISMHMAIVSKNKMHLKKTYQNLYCGDANWWLGFKTYLAVNDYYFIQRSRVYSASRTYRYSLNAAMEKLVSYYTCAYKCYMATGCLSYSAKTYKTQCKSLGKWYVYTPTIKYDLYSLGPLKAKFTPCQYKTLKTCNVDAAAGSISGVVADIKSKRDQFIKDFDAKYHTFRCAWVANFLKYKFEFARIVAIRHNFLCRHQRSIWTACGSLSYVQINTLAQMKKDLLVRAARVCAEYYRSLLARLDQADKAHADAKARFNASIDQLIASLTAKFNEYKSKRSANIAAYKKKLEQSRNSQRSALLNKMVKAKNDHWSKFLVMLSHYYGPSYNRYTSVRWMCDCYAHLLVHRCNSTLSRFDAHWRTMIPKLVMHYACCYKSQVKTYVFPKCASVPSWKYKLPCHATYTYRYSCFHTFYR